MQPQPQKKVARAHRIEGSIVLYRSAAKSQFKAQTSLLRAEPWWNMVSRSRSFCGHCFVLFSSVIIGIKVLR